MPIKLQFVWHDLFESGSFFGGRKKAGEWMQITPARPPPKKRTHKPKTSVNVPPPIIEF